MTTMIKAWNTQEAALKAHSHSISSFFYYGIMMLAT